jgi:hypothetical protein
MEPYARHQTTTSADGKTTTPTNRRSAASCAILYDPWWNPAVEAQAVDRSHRIGQDKPVFVHRLVMLKTIEEKMLELQRRWPRWRPGRRA